MCTHMFRDARQGRPLSQIICYLQFVSILLLNFVLCALLIFNELTELSSCGFCFIAESCDTTLITVVGDTRTIFFKSVINY